MKANETSFTLPGEQPENKEEVTASQLESNERDIATERKHKRERIDISDPRTGEEKETTTIEDTQEFTIDESFDFGDDEIALSDAKKLLKDFLSKLPVVDDALDPSTML